MQECLRYEDIVQTWGLTQIQISENSISFNVSGFNYNGKITIKTDDHGRNLVLNSNIAYIGVAKTALDAVMLLDKYIESNEYKYIRLKRMLTQYLHHLTSLSF